MSQQINLFNPLLLKQKKIFSAIAMARALFVLVCGVLALAYYANHSVLALQKEAGAVTARLKQQQARQADAVAKFLPRQKDPALTARIDAARTELQSLQKVATVLKGGEFGNTHGYSAYFKAFAAQSVSGLWLTGVTIVGAGNDIALRGRALQPNLVPAYISRLTHERIMQGKSFSSLKIDQPIQKSGTAVPDSGANDLASFVEFSLHSTPATAPGVAAQ